MKYTDLKKEHLLELANLRLANERTNNIYCINPTKITIEDKYTINVFVVSFIVKSKEYADYRMSIVFDKFYPNEFLLLQKIGITF